LSQQIKQYIRKDRGHSIVYSTTSIPSPVAANDSFRKLFDFQEESMDSSFDEKKVKKIEFSDSIKNGDQDKSIPFTYSAVDKLVFGTGS
jgi:hypothetical protein